MLSILLVQTAAARYVLPPAAELVVTADSIVEATVIGYDNAGGALLDVHEVYAGEPVTALLGLHYRCTPTTVEDLGFTVGGRYVFAVEDGRLIESRTAFPVEDDRVDFWTFDDPYATTWQDRETVRSAIAERRR